MERYRTTLIMIGILAVLAVAAFLATNRGNTTNSTATPTAIAYVYQGTDPVTAIEIVSGTGKVTLSKDVTTTLWTISEPVQDSADAFTVQSVADSLQNLQASRELTSTSDVAQYDLGATSIRVTTTLSDTARTKRTLLIGATTPDGSSFYVKREEAPNVYLVSNLTLEPLRSWLSRPPVQQPTPTPIPITVVPTSTVTATPGITSTVLLTGTVGLPPALSPTAVSTPPATTQPLTGTLPITNTVPGAANPTTPLVPTGVAATVTP